ncbi:site-2 protease family protein [Candidatus Woesearchaeota archaeon]|nr:site-2 protease family protein [Candidatus Woesearchaeota archaeon]
MNFVLALNEFKFTLVFYSLVLLAVYLNRKKFDVHGKFVFLYRTKFGINLMDTIANKARGLVKLLGSIGIIAGFAGMAFTFAVVLVLTYKLLLNQPNAAGASPVIPGLPIAGTGIVFPLITGWLVLFVIILVHEFSHGIVASAYKIKIKNSGIAFFGPILGAFVEPDEKELVKKSHWIQHSVFAAGAFSNFLTVAAVLLVIVLVLNPAVSAFSKGVLISPQPDLAAEKAGITNNTLLIGINNEKVSTINDFQRIMNDIGPGTVVELKSNVTTYTLTTIAHPDDDSKGYLGVWVIGEKIELKSDNIADKILFAILSWLSPFFGWLGFLSLNIGLINLLPVFITDGARMLKIFVEKIVKDKSRSLSIWLFFNWVSLFSLFILVFMPFFRWLNASLLSLIV